VLDAIFSASQKARFSSYIELTTRDLVRIVNAVVADDPKGVVNVPNTRKVRVYCASKKEQLNNGLFFFFFFFFFFL
jgi:hypothetical protein